MTSTAPTSSAPLSFLDEVQARTPGESHLMQCIQCGTCGGSCPSGADMDHTPRAIFAMIRADMREEVLRSNTPWYCVSCYYCTVRCPQDVKITEIMYTLKRLAVEAKLYGDDTAPDFSKTFINLVETYGRSFEIGLAGFHNVKHFITRLPSMTPMAIGMITKKGMSPVPPKRIKGMDQLKKILTRAKELEAE